MDKENMYTVIKNGKSSERKNYGGKKKGLSLNAENRAVCMTSVQSSSVSKAKFQIYSDGSDEIGRSRPRVRKDVCRKEIRARRDDKPLEKTIVSTMKVARANSSNICAVSRRARSSSNCRQKAFLDKTIMNNKLFHDQRSHSESRKISSQYAQSGIVQLSDVRKSKHLTEDVKKRTFSSIQMWKDKMRKPHSTLRESGTVPKNVNVNNRALSQVGFGIDKVYAKTTLRKSSITGSRDLQFEMSQNHTINENIEEPASKVDSLKDVLKHLSKEMAVILQDKSHLIQDDTNMRNSTSENTQNNNLNTTIVANSITPSDGPFSLLLTPTKVRYEKHVMTRKPSIKKENEFDIICETPYERDYLEDVPDTERKREDNAPKLSSRFLRGNVNAEQRRLIVGYVIRLGVHCHYSSHVIYRTIKLFNVAIDRILVKMNDIQLMALACLWIILKQEAPADKIPSATVLLELAKDLYINQEKYLLMYEKKILSAVKFNTQFADPFSLLSYYILNVNRDSRYNIIKPNDIVRVYFCGSYMIDLSMLDENLCDIPACVITVAAVELSLRFVYSSDVNVDQAWCQLWRSKQSLAEWEERMINSTKQIIMRHALEYDKFSSNVIYKKYMRSKYGKVTNFLHDKLKKIKI